MTPLIATLAVAAVVQSQATLPVQYRPEGNVVTVNMGGLRAIEVSSLLPNRPGSYNYDADSAVTAPGFGLRVNVRSYTTPPAAGSDRQRAFALLESRGFKVAEGATRVRLIYLPEPNARREIMVIFITEATPNARPHTMHMQDTMMRVRGTFEVKLAPLPTSHGDDSQLGRLSLDKTFEGDLVGTAKGEMLTAGTSVKNSAVYVAIERVSGTLHGKRGTFVLHHAGIMDRGAQQLSISVVPDSGTDELSGISGTLKITIADGKHSYDFDYTLSKTG